MFNPDTATGSAVYMPSLETAARSLKVVPITAPVHSDAEIETAIIALGREPGGGLVVMPDIFIPAHRVPIILAAARNNIAAVCRRRIDRACRNAATASPLRQPTRPLYARRLNVVRSARWRRTHGRSARRRPTAAYAELRRQGRTINDDLLRHVAPLGWEHIGLTGDYVWSGTDQPRTGTLRPLRQPQSLLTA